MFGLSDLFKDKPSLFNRPKPTCQCGSAGIIEICEEILKTGNTQTCPKCEHIITVEHAKSLLDNLTSKSYVWCKEKKRRIGYEVCMKNQETCGGCRDYEKRA